MVSLFFQKFGNCPVLEKWVTSAQFITASLILSLCVCQVKQGFEPVMFTCNFLAWNPEFWSQEQSYEEYMKSVDIGIVSASEEMKKYDDSRKYTFKELQKDPEGIDLTRKEV